ncbi:type IV secretion system protein [Legionella lytica]|uniref:Type IV secretion system protein n=1 Tax=Legionella lytica TaxID=96232 RepID=A0ABW8DBB1_9GAMM
MDFKVAPETFINDIIHVVDSLTGELIQSGFKAIGSNWIMSGLMTSLLALYLIHFLYQVKWFNTPISDATRHIVKVCFTFLVATNWDVFYILVYQVATNEPLHVLKLLLAKEGNAFSDGSLNDTFISGLRQTMNLLANMPLSFKGVVCCVLGAFLLLLGTFLFTILALSLIIISKFYLAVYLAIAPYFIVMFLFQGTKGLSESWVRSIVNTALVPVFVGSVLLLTTVLAHACLNTGASLGANTKAPDFMGVALYLFAAIVSAFLIKTIPEKAASITSSLAIAGAGRIANYAQNMGSKTNDVGSRMANAAQGVKNNFAQRQDNLRQEIRRRAQIREQQHEEMRERRARSGY